MIGGSWCSKSRLAKAAGAEVAVQQTGEKWRAAVAKTTFLSQNVQNTSWSEHFLKFRCRKMARRCGAKHIFKSKCTKHLSVGAILEVPKSKNGTLLWREAHLQVKMLKNWRCRSHFGRSDLKKWHAAVARSTFVSQNVQNTTCSGHFWTLSCSKMARRCGANYISRWKCAKHRLFAAFSKVSNWLAN